MLGGGGGGRGRPSSGTEARGSDIISTTFENRVVSGGGVKDRPPSDLSQGLTPVIDRIKSDGYNNYSHR